MTVPSKTLSADTVKAWAEQLPHANKPLVARETFELIERLRESRLSSRQQLAILDVIDRPVTTILGHIRRRLATGYNHVDQLLPLGEAYCEHLVAICTALLPHSRKWRRFGLNAALFREALRRANYYLEQWYLLRVTTQHVAPKGFWRKVNELAGASGPGEGAPIARLTALHLAGPSRMTVRQIQSLDTLLHGLPMAALPILGDGRRCADRPMFFLSAMGAAPTYGRPPDDAVTFDMERLIASLGSNTEAGLDRDMLDSIVDRWRGVWFDKEERRLSERLIKAPIIIGLQAVIRHFGEPSLPSLNDDGDQDTQAEVIEMGTVGQRTFIKMDLSEQQAESTQAGFLDLSEGGCRLRVSWDGIQVGDIVAVHWGHVEWRIGSLSWVVRNHDEAECGVRWLFKRPQTVMVRFDEEPPLVGLMGTHHGGSRQGVVVERARPTVGEHCLIHTDEDWQAFKWTRRMVSGLAELAYVEKLAPVAAPITASTQKLPPPTPRGRAIEAALAAMGSLPASPA